MKTLLMMTALMATFGIMSWSHAQEVLNSQSSNLAEAASCTADAMEQEELDKAADELEAKYLAERGKWKKKADTKKDPYGIEAALGFFAPTIFPDQYYTSFTEDDSYKKEFNRVSNFGETVTKNKNKVDGNKDAFDPEKTDFLSGQVSTKNGSPAVMSDAQKEALEAYQNELLDVLMANKGCDAFHFDLSKSKLSQKYFEDLESAKKFATNHDLHASKLERCEGPFEKKSTSHVATPIAESEKVMECPGLESFFVDNQWELEPEQVMAANTKFYKKGTCQEITPCEANSGTLLEMKGRLQSDANSKYAAAKSAIDSCVAQLKGKEILGVDIESSASRYKNTGIACSMSFAQLSQNRAESARDLFMKSLDAQKIEYKTDLKKAGASANESYLFDFNIDSGGQWGAYVDAITKEGKPVDPKFQKLVGSSGPAPGELEKSEYDQFKYVRISVRYKDKKSTPPADAAKAKYQVICKSIGFQCDRETSSTKKYRPQKSRGTRGHFAKPKYAKSKKSKKDKSPLTRCTW